MSISWKELLGNKKILCVLLIEVLLACFGVIGLFLPVKTEKVSIGVNNIVLSPGVYDVHIRYYAAGDGNQLSIQEIGGDSSAILFNTFQLSRGENSEVCQLWSVRRTGQISIDILGDNPGEVQVYDVEVQRTNAGSRIFLFIVFGVSFCVNLLIRMNSKKQCKMYWN